MKNNVYIQNISSLYIGLSNSDLQDWGGGLNQMLQTDTLGTCYVKNKGQKKNLAAQRYRSRAKS